MLLGLVLAHEACRRRLDELTAKDREEGTGVEGPTALGYEFPLRVGVGGEYGKYSDKQVNADSPRRGKLKDLITTGVRASLEHYEGVGEPASDHSFWYFFGEFRSSRTSEDYWQKRQTGLVLFGPIIPYYRLIAPVIGMHWEFNHIKLDDPKTPEVARVGIRALALGIDIRRMFWGGPMGSAAFYGLKLHSLNPGNKSNGWEGEASLGMALQYGGFRSDWSLGWLDQTYQSIEQRTDGNGKVTVDSHYQSLSLMVSLWL